MWRTSKAIAVLDQRLPPKIMQVLTVLLLSSCYPRFLYLRMLLINDCNHDVELFAHMTSLLNRVQMNGTIFVNTVN